MRILLADATGAIGRPLLPKLLVAGHEVIATTRSAERAAALEAAGAKSEIVDFLDLDAVEELVARVKPEVVIDQLTSLPENFNPRKAKTAYAANNRIRRVGTGTLVAAAKANSVERYIVQSVAFMYKPGGAAPRSETDPLWIDAPEPFGESVEVMAANEVKVAGSRDFVGVVLRFGFIYGPGTWWATDGSTTESIGKRQYPLVGPGSGVNSMLHVSDAASSVMRALDADAGVYNIVDDEPAPFNELIPYVAELIGAKPPRRFPTWLARIAVGKYLAAAATTLPGASNQKAKAELGWSPAIPSWRDGLREHRDKLLD